MDTPSFFKKSGKSVLVNCDTLSIYIPKSYFDIRIAEIVGDKLIVLGIFYFVTKVKEKAELRLSNIPSSLNLSFQSEHTEVTDIITGEKDSYRVFVLERGDVFMESLGIIPSGKNIESFVNLLHSGKLPKTTYESVYKQYIQVQDDNNMSLGVPSTTLESIIAELYRDKDDLSIPHRLGEKGSDYESVNIKDLPKLISTFSGISFERIGDALAAGVERKLTGKQNKISQMEQTIKY